MASLSDIQNLIEQLEARMEARMNEALAAQRTALIAELGGGNGNGVSAGGSGPATSNQGPAAEPTNPALNLDDMPSKTASELEAQKMREKLELLERSITALKTHKEVVDMDSLSLFPEARLPTKFKMPNMDKFDGTTCPKTHLKMYVGALNPFGLNSELLAQLFQQSLTGAALRWFVSLDRSKIKNWEDICNAFNTQYHYNLEVDVTRRELETTRQKNNEPFSSFLSRWRVKAAQMINRPSEQEQVDIIIKNLLPIYQSQLQTQYLPTFQSLIATATKVEDIIQLGQLKEDSYKKQNHAGL